MNTRPTNDRPRRAVILLTVLALSGLSGITVACSPRTEKPAENTVAPSAETNSPAPQPTEKAVQTNVTRTPMSVSPNGGSGGGNPAVPCGFGPAGGGPCTNR